jgi:hypothetical protein
MIQGGHTETPMVNKPIKRASCRHQWTPRKSAGILDSTGRGDCKLCNCIQTRKRDKTS